MKAKKSQVWEFSDLRDLDPDTIIKFTHSGFSSCITKESILKAIAWARTEPYKELILSCAYKELEFAKEKIARKEQLTEKEFESTSNSLIMAACLEYVLHGTPIRIIDVGRG